MTTMAARCLKLTINYSEFSVLPKMAENSKKLDKAKFMDEVQQYNCLYNKFRIDFNDKYKSANRWKALGSKFTIQPQEPEPEFFFPLQ